MLTFIYLIGSWHNQWTTSVLIWNAHITSPVIPVSDVLHNHLKGVLNIVFALHLVKRNKTINQSVLVNPSRHVSCRRQLPEGLPLITLIETHMKCRLYNDVTRHVIYASTTNYTDQNTIGSLFRKWILSWFRNQGYFYNVVKLT